MNKLKNSLPTNTWGSRLAVVAAVVASAMGVGAQAATVTQTINVNSSATLSGFTNVGPHTFFTLPSVFDQFDSGTGTLTGASVSWTTTGQARADGNLEAQGRLTFRGQSASVNVDTDGSPANDQTFSFNGTDTFASLVPLLGIGTVNIGDFVGTMSEVGGLFPWGGFLSVSGTMTLTYEYTANSTGGGGTGGGVPEPSPLALAALVLAGLALTRRQRSRRA